MLEWRIGRVGTLQGLAFGIQHWFRGEGGADCTLQGLANWISYSASLCIFWLGALCTGFQAFISQSPYRSCFRPPVYQNLRCFLLKIYCFWEKIMQKQRKKYAAGRWANIFQEWSRLTLYSFSNQWEARFALARCGGCRVRHETSN